MADVLDSKSGPRKRVWVQVPPSVLTTRRALRAITGPYANVAKATSRPMLTADGLRRRYSSGRSVIGMQEGIALCRTQDQSGRQSRVIGRIPGPRKIGMVSPELRTSKDRYGVPGTPCPRNSGPRKIGMVSPELLVPGTPPPHSQLAAALSRLSTFASRSMATVSAGWLP
jgi:hypothetical protein